jgi:proteasome alpha subunit
MMPPTAYDRAITIFSPEGKLYQVEYAFEAVKKGWTSLGLRTKTAVVLAAEKRKAAPLIDLRGVEKIFRVDDHIGVTFAGMGSDGRVLVDYARLVAARHRLLYGEPATIEYVVKAIADLKQMYTQHGGVRPFGVALIFGGIDVETRVYRTEPGGQYFSFYATAIGVGSETAINVLEKSYRYEADLEEALELVVLTLLKSKMASEERAKEKIIDEFPETVEIGYLTVDKPVFKVMKPDEVREYLERVKGKVS